MSPKINSYSSEFYGVMYICAIILTDILLQTVYSILHALYIFGTTYIWAYPEITIMLAIIIGPLIYYININVKREKNNANDTLKSFFYPVIIVASGGLILSLSEINIGTYSIAFSSALWITFLLTNASKIDTVLRERIHLLIVFYVYPIYFIWGILRFNTSFWPLVLFVSNISIATIIGYRIFKITRLEKSQ